MTALSGAPAVARVARELATTAMATQVAITAREAAIGIMHTSVGEQEVPRTAKTTSATSMSIVTTSDS